MANTLLTPSVIAREAIITLVNNLVMGGLVHTDYSDEFAKVGDTVTIRKPATFTAQEFSSEITLQNATEGSTTVKLDKHIDISFAVTSKELALSIQDFSKQFIVPAVTAHAQYIDAGLCSLYKYVPYRGAVSTTPVMDDLALVEAIMDENKVPNDGQRALVLGPRTHAKYVVLPAILNAEKSGTTDALRRSSMGRVLGFESFKDQNIVSHTAGAGTVLIDLVAGYTKETWNATKTGQDIHVDGVTTALKVGDLLTIGTLPYVIVAAGELATADQDITIYPALKADAANDDPVTLIASGVANLAFHRNAFALVSRPLATPLGAARSEVINYGGLSIRVVYGYNMTTKTDTISLDMLCGFKCLTPELACRLTG